MWSKLFNWSSKQANTTAQPNPNELVRLALAEIDKNIASNQQAWRDTQATQVQIQGKLKAQLLEINAITEKAEKALKRNEDATARNLWTQKIWLQEQAQQYQHLLTQLAQTIQQLEKQIAGLEMRKIEITTKETLLTAQLQKVTSQKDMQNYLGELDKTLGFDSYEKQIQTISIENQLANDILAFDEALENTQPDQTITQMQQQIATEQREVQEKKMNTIFTRYFDAKKVAQQETQKAQDFNKMRSDLLASFFTQKNLPAPTEQTEKQAEPNKVITDFFANTEAKNDQTPNKQKQIDDFFNR